MKKLLIATRNKGKFPEIVLALKGLPLQMLNLNDVPELAPDYEVEEPGTTFEGNALIKAMTLGHKTGMMVLSDDSGLEVDALGGRPGVYSARYAEGGDAARRAKLLGEMKDVPEENRGAQFQCVIAIYDPATEKVRTCTDAYRGRITREEKGENGFGYDAIFFNESLQKTNAEMSIEEKNGVSARGKALVKAREVLEKEFLA
jgi:XTP/dITP diphosphohydrolase